LAEDAQGESTKWRKTYGKKPPCLKILPDGAATAADGISTARG
jgi:hypothetical protein